MFQVEIQTDNEAFSGGGTTEVQIILAKIIARLETGHTDGKCMDTNGNTVGSWVLNAD